MSERRSNGSGRKRRDRVRFVLVRPRSPGNVGSTARVLKNLGFHRLVLAAPVADRDAEEARRMAVAADDVLRDARVEPGLDRALTGAAVVVGTTRRAGKHRRPHFAFGELAGRIAASIESGNDVAVVYGPEDHGLSDDELDRCTHLGYLPASDDYPSFNLAQAVAITAWIVADAIDPERSVGESASVDEPASDHGEREDMYRHLEAALLTVGFLHRDSVEPMMRRFRRLIGRAAPTSAEIQMLRGVARQVLWAADRAGLPRLDRETIRDDRAD